MEWIFPIGFVFAFIVTKKDLALVCAAVGIASASTFTFCNPESWSFEEMIMINMSLNLILAALSGVHWSNTRKSLARALAWIATAAVGINLFQVFIDGYYTEYMLLILQSIALMAIIFLDGRREYVDDVAASMSSIARRMGLVHGNSNSGKGRT
tara:strand:- start:1125 stop:1586 length:462 start_codon:yes stop_codon:yes gene_type:complete